RGGHEPNANALDIIKRVAERMDLKPAAIAGASIDFADRETAPEASRDGASKLRARGLEGRCPFAHGLRARCCNEVFEQTPAHDGLPSVSATKDHAQNRSNCTTCCTRESPRRCCPRWQPPAAATETMTDRVSGSARCADPGRCGRTRECFPEPPRQGPSLRWPQWAR